MPGGISSPNCPCTIPVGGMVAAERAISEPIPGLCTLSTICKTTASDVAIMQDKASVGGHEPQSKVSGFRVLGHLPAFSTRDLNSSNWPSCRCVTSYKKKKGLINFWRVYC
jgi:hypothetical protein